MKRHEARAVELLEKYDIAPGGKMSPLACKDHGPNTAIGSRAIKRLLQSPTHFVIDRIACLRPRNHDTSDAGVQIIRPDGHGTSLLAF